MAEGQAWGPRADHAEEAATEAPERVPEIQSALSGLEGELEVLEQLIHKIEDRLQPVLSPGGDANARPETPTTSPIGGVLANDRRRIERMNDALSDLLNRIEV